MDISYQEVLDKASSMFPSEIAIAAQAVEIDKLRAENAELKSRIEVEDGELSD